METQKQKKVPKFWGWQGGVFGKPLPKYKFKSGYVPELTAPAKDTKKGHWIKGKWVDIPETPENLKKYERMDGPEALEYWRYKFLGLHKEKFEAEAKKAQRAAPEVKVSRPEKETKIKKTYLGNKVFIGRLEGGIYDMNKKSLQNPTLLLLYLLQHQNWENKKDKHNTWDKWYLEKELIVASRSEEKMAADLEVSVRTIQRWSAALERDGLIIKVKEGRENVYILGRVVGQDRLYLYSGGTKVSKIKSLMGDKGVI